MGTFLFILANATRERGDSESCKSILLETRLRAGPTAGRDSNGLQECEGRCHGLLDYVSNSSAIFTPCCTGYRCNCGL